MNMSADEARADLAFLRGLVEGVDKPNPSFAEGYLAGGLIYGVQMLLHAGQALNLFPQSGLLALLIGLGPTAVFLPVIIWVNWKNRSFVPTAAAPKAVASVFAAVGLANLALIAVIGSVAWQMHSLTVWLIYPCAVFVLQGAAWLLAFVLRRRAWHGLVGIGWFGWGIGMALTILNPPAFIAVTGLALLTCMVVPGVLMVLDARRGP